jgi:hypothetical protein
MPVPAALTEEHITQYQRSGHVLIRRLLDPRWLSGLRPGILTAFERNRPKSPTRPATAYEKAFIQIVNMGLTEPTVRELTWSPILGAVAARLMGVAGARIFIEDSMFKEPGGGHTPWHQDGSCLPFEPQHMVTAWIPLVDVSERNGSLRFVAGSHRRGLLGPVDISEETDALFQKLIDEERLPIDANPPMQPGDVSFHAGTTIHSASPNGSPAMRELMAIHYFADGSRVGELDNPAKTSLVRHSAPELGVGDLAVSPAWPLVYSAEPEPDGE